MEYSLGKEMPDEFNTLNREQNISFSCGNTEITIGISNDNLLRLINTSFVVLTN